MHICRSRSRELQLPTHADLVQPLQLQLSFSPAPQLPFGGSSTPSRRSQSSSSHPLPWFSTFDAYRSRSRSQATALGFSHQYCRRRLLFTPATTYGPIPEITYTLHQNMRLFLPRPHSLVHSISAGLTNSGVMCIQYPTSILEGKSMVPG
ncbi:hypothetical protein EX30DRAFT_273850 [Ascodesmis nigricans]|uniref:Uncharacterized protein n=1 Tax=Ascodesmis nigricans TaxID=341454 RepID=A0A4S2MHG5_9PEZI|nr:hypothetical protein EX30DRAFT_273850 [Ascodesmis nigricans]